MAHSNIIKAVFWDEEPLVDAAIQLRKKKVKIAEVFSPFPIHGIDPIIGIKPTKLSNAAFVYGTIGCSLALFMIWYMLINDWPMNIGGKPNFSLGQGLPAFIPVTFETTVFCTAHGMALSYFIINKIFPGQDSFNPDPRTTDDMFILEVDLERNKKISKDEIINTLKAAGCSEIREN
jgi:hypothetical protein